MTKRVRVGCELHYAVPTPTVAIMQIQPRHDGPARVLVECWETDPFVRFDEFKDLYGNPSQRMKMPAGDVVIHYDAEVEVTRDTEELDEDVSQSSLTDIPHDAVVYTLPSRYCRPETLADLARTSFPDVGSGYRRVLAVCDWAHDNLTSAPVAAYHDSIGAAGDATQLAITLCRALGIPARYVLGYVPGRDALCAWFEAYLADHWWPFGPETGHRGVTRIVVGRGRDAVDVAMMTPFGATIRRKATVWAEEVPHAVDQVACRDDPAVTRR